ncbi:MAG: hypothetical protein JWN86_3129 [Planctomycetota bacterium]|nr:hypothetical protein [Planctomycetota bacterium]
MTDQPDDSAVPDLAALATAVSRLAVLFESRIAPTLERIAEALERAPASAIPPDPCAVAVADIRRAIRDGGLARAGERLAEWKIEFPEAPETVSLEDELASASRVAVDDRRTRLDAARAANDPVAVLAYRDELAALLDSASLQPIDKDVLGWLMALLMKRMRTGTVRPDVASLAARIAESFAHRPEGASLRASLPTIRRSAGLCARCAEPYTGVEDACPQCLSGAPRIADLPDPPAAPT